MKPEEIIIDLSNVWHKDSEKPSIDEVYDSEFFEYWAYTHDLIPKDL